RPACAVFRVQRLGAAAGDSGCQPINPAPGASGHEAGRVEHQGAAGQHPNNAPRDGRHKRMKWTEKHWDAMCKLRSLDSPTRQASASTRALRMVLVDGMGVLEAAEAA